MATSINASIQADPNVQGLEKDATATMKTAADTVAKGLDAALDGVAAASPKLEAEALTAVEKVLEAFVSPAIRPMVELAIGMAPTGTVLKAVSAEEAQLIALAKLRINAVL